MEARVAWEVGGDAWSLVRRCLSQAVSGVAPATWTFDRTDAGKPFVTGPVPAPSFNLSHTDGLVACVLAPWPVGIDVEPIARGADILDTVLRAFAPAEIAALRALAPEHQQRRALELWTVKEAYLKGIGTGIARHLDRFEVRPGAAHDRWIAPEAPAWEIDVREHDRWILATAVPAGTIVVAESASRRARD